MQSEQKYKEKLFIDGINYFNDKNFYDAHEIWEELWNEYRIKDSIFIQGLIQVSVAYFHITNSNLKGARSLFKKSLPKFCFICLANFLLHPKSSATDTSFINFLFAPLSTGTVNHSSTPLLF